jgi:rhamnulose-1-phosphate aldolase
MKPDVLGGIAAPLLGPVAVVAGELLRHGWAEAGAGNFSLRVEAPRLTGSELDLPVRVSRLAGKTLLVKRTGARMRDVAANPLAALCLVQVSETGSACRIHPAAARPTSEFASHLAVHNVLLRLRPEDKAVLHCHPTATIALSLLIKDPRELAGLVTRMHSEGPVLLQGRVAALRFLAPGSIDLARATASALEKTQCAIWPGHGAIAVGPDLDAALDIMEMVDKAATIALYLGERRMLTSGLTFAQELAAREAAGLS